VAAKIADPAKGYGANVIIHDVRVISAANEFAVYKLDGTVSSPETALTNYPNNEPATYAPYDPTTHETSFMEGIKWTVTQIGLLQAKNANVPIVVQMSTLEQFAKRINPAVLNSLTALNVPIVMAAGNYNMVFEDKYPWARPNLPDVIVVGAVKKNTGPHAWEKRTDSTYGPNVDIYAPGEDLECYRTDFGDRPCNGTSYAAPYTCCGLVATMITIFPELRQDPAYAKTALLAIASKNRITNVGAMSNNFMVWHNVPNDAGVTLQAMKVCVTNNVANQANLEHCFDGIGEGLVDP